MLIINKYIENDAAILYIIYTRMGIAAELFCK